MSFLSIPPEILYVVLGFTHEPGDCASLFATCKSLHTLFDNDQDFWHIICAKKYQNLEWWSQTYSGDFKTICTKKAQTLAKWRDPQKARFTKFAMNDASKWRCRIDSRSNTLIVIDWPSRDGNNINTFNADDGGCHRHMLSFPGRPVCLAPLPHPDPSKSLWVFAGYSNSILIYDVVTGQQFSQLHGHRQYCTSMDPFGDGQLVTAGWEGDVLVHDYMTGFGNSIRCVKTTTSKKIIAGGHGHAVHIWDEYGNTLARFSLGEGHYILSLGIRESLSSRDPQDFGIDTIVATGTGGMVHLIRPVVEDGIFVNWSTKVFDGHEGQIYQLAFDEKRRRIITGGQDLSVFIFDEDTGEILHKLQLEELVSCMKFDPIRNILAVGSNDSCVRVWDLNTMDLLLKHTGYGFIYELDFDEDMLLTSATGGHEPSYISLWDFRFPPEPAPPTTASRVFKYIGIGIAIAAIFGFASSRIYNKLPALQAFIRKASKERIS